MSSKWFYVENEAEVGPVSSQVIKQKVREGVIGPEDEVWKEGLPDWVPARKIKGLFSTTTSRPSPVRRPAARPAAPSGDDWLDDLPDLPDEEASGMGMAGGGMGGGAVAAPLADRLSRQSRGGGEFLFGGFWQRFVAVFIDGIILFFVNFAITVVAAGIIAAISQAGPGQPGRPANIVNLLAGLAQTIIGVLYYAIQESSDAQATIGKRAMSLIVTDTGGNRISFARALGRYFARWLSAITFGIGYLIQPFTARKQALHDLICGTLVCQR